jgi:hypothetical protein
MSSMFAFTAVTDLRFVKCLSKAEGEDTSTELLLHITFQPPALPRSLPPGEARLASYDPHPDPLFPNRPLSACAASGLRFAKCNAGEDGTFSKERIFVCGAAVAGQSGLLRGQAPEEGFLRFELYGSASPW